MARSALDLTYVLYDETSHVSHALALLTLSPILINPAYAALSVQTREILYVEMWAGQMLCECFNYVLKKAIKQERPHLEMGDGYGFPSSHSQWMGYFATFLVCHFTFRHRFVTTGYRIIDSLRDILLYIFIISWSASVAFSRYYLTYHTAEQVLWGYTIGIVFGLLYYTAVELVPSRAPHGLLGSLKTRLLTSTIFTWFRIRDSWTIWSDGGLDPQYLRWRTTWDAAQALQMKKSD
ncbi:hypothetical protein QCA50_012336 [Cerrena zonata]|uniref:Dolichyldiphosphatase n=1 Tax=Cerrena zonata TaxID=2478898 RepID=A0AAW0FY90_9APHY